MFRCLFLRNAVRRLPMAVRRSSRLLVFTILLLCCTGVLLFLRCRNICATWLTATESSAVWMTESLAQKASPATNSAPDLNWTTCPSKNELQSEHHFRLWDEKLAQALRFSAQGPPRTEQESWHAVTDDIHIFSAFLVTTKESAIHITSLVRSHKPKLNSTPIQHPPLVCIIRTSNSTIRREARIQLVWTWLNPSFKNALILCPPLNRTIPVDEDIRVAVAIRGSLMSSLRWLQLHRPPERAEGKCCAVCVRPSYGSSISLWKIVEFISHYRLVGVSTFYFYDLQMSSDAKLLLAWLQSAGVDVTLVPFKLIADTGDVHAHGQMPGLYDCIFRSMSRMEYYIHVDIDELMVPLRHSSIPALVQEVEHEGNGSVASLDVRSRYYCSEYPLNLQYSSLEDLPLQTRLFTYHSVDLHQQDFTKHIARSRSVCEAGVHSVEQHCTGYNKLLVDSSVAFINHYRRCCEFTQASAVHKWNISLWSISHLAVHHSFIELSAHIESDPLVRTIRSLIP
ncbi:uncharacterized protein [Dermacentor andersoni]|uniref:uncharacterized protein isoform X1 n=2 Tax=Dermacentor andersoni TaxID=34620 RepID=UPI0021554952|nr:uncharacterized protein LOC126544742 isoform X1 [Dermacentor andersoni]